jgi:hypothetical protein
MGIASKWAAPLLAALAAAWCCVAATPAPAPRAPGSDTGAPVVHEWGTFSTFSGSDGNNLKFEPYDNDLPDFVHGYLPRHSKEGPAGGTISLETPVLYFYTPHALTASVEVDFPRGTMTEWYPAAARTARRLVWRGVEVLPGQEVRLPSGTQESRYYAARETDAAPLRAARPQGGTEGEKFLFYRGVGNFTMPLSARALSGDSFSVRWQGNLEGDLILVQVREGKVRFQPFRLGREPAGGLGAEVRVPAADATAGELGEALVKVLTAQGLFEKEARAMVKTWSSAWFGEEGTRVLYVLPRALTDELLPLRVEPRPAEVVRVLVGRHDVLTPERERQIDSWVAELKRPGAGDRPGGRAASAELNKLGRYRGAAWRAAQSRLAAGR